MKPYYQEGPVVVAESDDLGAEVACCDRPVKRGQAIHRFYDSIVMHHSRRDCGFRNPSSVLSLVPSHPVGLQEEK